MENINPENLVAAGKKQNNIIEYRKMMLEWKRHHILIMAGNILGFPNDTTESISRDLDIIMNELPIDMLATSYLTPLPGSEDHKKMLEDGDWMDPDLNKYDLGHLVINHPKMSSQDYQKAFRNTYFKFSSFKHLKKVLKRNAALGSNKKYTTADQLTGMRLLSYVHGNFSYEVGLFKMKYRKDRRSGLPLENPILFYIKYFYSSLSTSLQAIYTYYYLRWQAKRIFTDPKRYEYTDKAIAPVTDDELATLDLFNKTEGGQASVVKFHKREKTRKEIREKRRMANADKA
jgi:hypothetical protein